MVGVEGVCRGGVLTGADVSWIIRHYQLGIYVDGVSAKLNIAKKLNTEGWHCNSNWGGNFSPSYLSYRAKLCGT